MSVLSLSLSDFFTILAIYSSIFLTLGIFDVSKLIFVASFSLRVSLSIRKDDNWLCLILKIMREKGTPELVAGVVADENFMFVRSCGMRVSLCC